MICIQLRLTTKSYIFDLLEFIANKRVVSKDISIAGDRYLVF